MSAAAADTGEALGLAPHRLTLTFGFGHDICLLPTWYASHTKFLTTYANTNNLRTTYVRTTYGVRSCINASLTILFGCAHA